MPRQTLIHVHPDAAELAEITVMAAEEMRRFGLQPKAALLSHSNFGSSELPSAQKMRAALAIVQLAVARAQVALDAAVVQPMPVPGGMLFGSADRFIHCRIPRLSQFHAI
mgnify:CR=1 FL=1